MSGSRLERLLEAVRVLQVHTERASAKLASVPLLARQRLARHLREANEAVDVARTRLLDTTTDETGPAPAVSAELAAELAPDTRPSVAPGDPVAAARADGRAEGSRETRASVCKWLREIASAEEPESALDADQRNAFLEIVKMIEIGVDLVQDVDPKPEGA